MSAAATGPVRTRVALGDPFTPRHGVALSRRSRAPARRSRESGTSAIAEQRQRRDEHAVDPAPVGGEPADQAADDLADGEEDRVEPHDRATVGGEALGDVGQQAERGGRRPGQHEQAGAGHDDGGHQDHDRQPARVVHDQPGADQAAAADDPVAG